MLGIYISVIPGAKSKIAPAARGLCVIERLERRRQVEGKSPIKLQPELDEIRRILSPARQARAAALTAHALLSYESMAVDPSSASKVMVRAPNWLGDAVMSLPALRQIRATFSRAHLAVVARPSVAELYARESSVDQVIPYA